MGNRLLRELEVPQGEIPVGQDEEDFTTATPSAITHITQDQKPIWTPVEVVPELDSRTPDPRGDLTEVADEEDGRSVSHLEEERRQEVPEATVDKDEFAQLQRLVVDLNSEREALKDEVRRLNEKIKAEGAEWRQFQRDMHLAVTVADRLRLEAETEMEVLRARLEEEAGKRSALQEGLERKQRCHVDVVDGQENQALSDSLVDGPQGPNGIKYRPHLDSNPSSGGPLTSEGRTAPCGDRKESEDPLRWEASPSDVTGVRGEDNREKLKMQQNEAAASPSATSSIETHVNRSSCEKVRETLSDLVKRSGGSKRNTLLTWCKTKTTGYPNIEITNFSSSWSDGLAFCALLHTYLPDQIPYRELHAIREERNLRLAFNVLRGVGIKTTMDVEALMRGECHWQDVLFLVESVYNHFET